MNKSPEVPPRPVRIPSFSGLRAFEAAARHLSFTKAAMELNVTQTAVSHQVHRLEEELSVKLFTRDRHCIALTKEGQEFLPGVSSALAILRAATEDVKSGNYKHVLRISTLASFAQKWLLPRLPAFQDRHPEITVRITTSPEYVDLRRKGLDLAIRYGHGQWEGVQSEWLMRDSIFPVCSPKFARDNNLHGPEDLQRCMLIKTIGVTEEDWHNWLLSVKSPLHVESLYKFEFDLTVVSIQAAIDGLGIAIGRTSYVASDIAAGRLVAPFAQKIESEGAFYSVTPVEKASKPRVQAFRNWLAEVVVEEGSR